MKRHGILKKFKFICNNRKSCACVGGTCRSSRIDIAANSAGQLAAAGKMTSDKGTFDTSVSTTDMYCTNIQSYNNATIDRDL